MKRIEKDPRVRRAVLPTRVLWQDGDVQNAEVLLHNDWGQALAQAVECCTMRNAATHTGSSLLLDFGRELHGGLQIVTGPTAGNRVARVRLRFGESVSEAMHEPNNDHAVHDMEIALPPMGSAEFGLTGFRFVRLDLLDEIEVPIVACRVMTLMRELPAVGAFRCSDERLNRIWQVGADTVHLCLQDFVWDGIKRDRLVWIGDMHPETAVITAVWGALDIVPQSLDWARDHTPLPEWMNGIGSYSMWWLLIQRDWFMAHGDRAYLEEQRTYLIGLLPILIEQIRDDGSVDWRGHTFLDWPSSENPIAVRAGLVALLVMALRAGAQLCEELGETAGRDAALQAAARLQAPPVPLESKQASALLALSGLHDANAVNEQALAREPLCGISTFYGYYVLQARAEAGDYARCLDVIRRYWGAMLDLGATSFWEDFDLEWIEDAARIDELIGEGQRDLHRERGAYCYQGLRHSLCHGWAAGPTAWLSEHVLGLRVLEPGAAKVLCAPHLGDLEWAEGAYPTPHGTITVRHERRADGHITSRIEAPPGVEIVHE
ncbi:MAG: hypothetical protein JWN98_1368 [Abditibacteriota bacterium]|nr:hypothetical protein [Abditibacteriota bacterium]